MDEHDGNGPADPTDPHDELEPIDLAALFGDELDDDLERDDVVAEPDEADALLLTQVFAADLADEPASLLTTADILAAAGDAARAGAGRAENRPARDPAVDRARTAAVDELATRRRRRTWVSRGLLAAAAVAVLAVGATAALTSGNGSDTASSAESGARPAAAPAFSAAGTSGAQAPEAGPQLSASSGAAGSAPTAPGSGGSSAAATVTAGAAPMSSRSTSSDNGGAAPGSETSASESVQESTRPPGPYNPDELGRCQLLSIPEPATIAAMRALGGVSQIRAMGPSAVLCDVDLPGVTSGTFVTPEGNRVTVLLFADGVTAMPFSVNTGGSRRSVELGDTRLRVVVSVAVHSSLTDQQLLQVARAVLDTQR